MKFDVNKMLEYYADEANKHGHSGTSTIQDMRTRLLEINAISKYIKEKQKILEPGCGNGYTAWKLTKTKQVFIDAYDLCEELISLAKARSKDKLKGDYNFFHADACVWKKENNYDTIFTERVLQNIPLWDNQQIALENIYMSLKKGGYYIMEECFMSGLNNLNQARQELDLPFIDEPWHNVFFDDKALFTFMSTLGFKKVAEDNFLSGYYFGSRVLLAALYPKDKKLLSASILNEYFCNLPPAGNFSPMRIVIFEKH